MPLAYLLFVALTLVSAVSHADGEKEGELPSPYFAPAMQDSTDEEVNHLRNRFDRLYEQLLIPRSEVGEHATWVGVARYVKFHPAMFYYPVAGALLLNASFSPFTYGHFDPFSAIYGSGFYLFSVSVNSLSNTAHSNMTTKLANAREGKSPEPSNVSLDELERRLIRNETLDCRSTFLRLANPFRSSRIVSRWVPMGVGAAAGHLPHLIENVSYGPSEVFQRAKDALKDPKSLFEKRF